MKSDGPGPSRTPGTARKNPFEDASILRMTLAFGLGLIAAFYLWFPVHLLERRIGERLESKLPEGVALRTFDYRPPFTLDVTPVTEVAGRRVSLPLRFSPRMTLGDFGLGFTVPPDTSLSGTFWLWGRHLEVDADRFRLAKVLPVEGRLTGRLEARLAGEPTGRFEGAATFPDLVLFRGVPGIQGRLTLERIEGEGELEGRRITLREAAIRGEELHAEADGEVELRSPLPSSSLRLSVRMEQPTRRQFEQTSTLGGFLALLEDT